jgi:hypothetical protein
MTVGAGVQDTERFPLVERKIAGYHPGPFSKFGCQLPAQSFGDVGKEIAEDDISSAQV